MKRINYYISSILKASHAALFIVAIGIVGYILAVTMRAIEAKLCRWSVRGK